MKRLVAALCIGILPPAVIANTTDCQNLYVGRILVENGQGGLTQVVFLNSPTDSSGSYWVHFSSWAADDKKAALVLLTAAKLAQHRVNLTTTATNGCNIQTDDTVAKDVVLANNP